MLIHCRHIIYGNFDIIQHIIINLFMLDGFSFLHKFLLVLLVYMKEDLLDS
jgi:hypothetical protein